MWGIGRGFLGQRMVASAKRAVVGNALPFTRGCKQPPYDSDAAVIAGDVLLSPAWRPLYARFGLAVNGGRPLLRVRKTPKGLLCQRCWEAAGRRSYVVVARLGPWRSACRCADGGRRKM